MDAKELADIMQQAQASHYFRVDTLEQMIQLKAQAYDICCCDETVSCFMFIDGEWVKYQVQTSKNFKNFL